MPEETLKPIRPELDTPSRQGSERQTIHSMTLAQLTHHMATEMANVGDLEHILKSIEAKLLTPEYINQITDLRSLSMVYDIVSRRKKDAQTFMLKILELGVKTSILSKLVEGTGPAPVGKKIPKLTQNIISLRDKLRELADQKSAEDTHASA